MAACDDDSLKRNLDEENKNAENDEYIDNPQIKNDKINSQSHENIRKRLLLKRFSMKIFDLILSSIVIYEKDILSVDYINQKIETKEKWNQINVLDMDSMLVANCLMPLLHMSKTYIWMEETNQRINDFYFGYIINPNLYEKKYFKEQVKACFRNTFGKNTNSHINTILMKKIQECLH